MNLLEINFPVFRLKESKPLQEEGVCFYLVGEKIQVIDDINVPGETLAHRRMCMTMDKVPLLRLKIAIFYLGDLIKLAKPTQWFIDSSGKVFKYAKEKLVPLIFKEILNVERRPAHVLITAKDIHGKHPALYAPLPTQKYAGFLRIKAKTYVLYGFYEEKHKDTRRKI